MRRAAPARAAAHRTIRRVFETGAYGDRALRGELEGLDARDRALATRLVFGTVQRRATLDALILRFGSRPLERLDPPVLASLRLGAYGLLFLDRAPAHATVNDSVTLAGRAGAGYVNAVLRRIGREGRAALDALGDATAPEAAIRHSVPDWLAALWFAELGPDAARGLLATVNQPAEAGVRVNTLRADPAAVQAALPVAADPAPGLPEGLLLRAPFDVHGSAAFAAGELMPQSRASMLVGRVLDPRPGERILDLCAAPGGKTTHLAALAGDRGEVVAVERHAGRAAALERTCERLGARSVLVVRGDAADAHLLAGEAPFARILVDPPCSGLGTLRSRPDLRWRVAPAAVDELAELQSRILDVAVAHLAPGGCLVYSVCTISHAEGPDQVAACLARHPDLAPDDLHAEWAGFGDPAAAPHLQLRPDLDGTDGFFIARLRRDGG